MWALMLRDLGRGGGLVAPSPLMVMERDERRRIRHAQAAPDRGAGQIQDAAAQSVLHQPVLTWLPAVVAIFRIPDLVTGEGLGGRWGALALVLLLFGSSGHGIWYRRQARRSLEANSRRWGPV